MIPSILNSASDILKRSWCRRFRQLEGGDSINASVGAVEKPERVRSSRI